MSNIDPKDAEVTPAGPEAGDARLSLGGLMRGKRVLMTGVANDRSIAWAIAQAFQREGAELAFTYPGEAMERRVRPLAESIGAKAILDCDVSKDEDIDRTVAELKQGLGPRRRARPLHRVRAARRARRPLRRRDHARGVAHHDGRLGVLAHRPRARVQADDARRARAS